MGLFTSLILGSLAVAGAASQITGTIKQEKRAKEDANRASQQNAAAVQSVKDAQSEASTQASTQIRRKARAGTQTTFTSPLGITTQAKTAKKMLLGE